ncbi:MAG: hypothetical protein IT336_09935 [Thermomicrobiales bacterium]|nr:hypothetical protein [Thermomicrobiales bacterium]
MTILKNARVDDLVLAEVVTEANHRFSRFDDRETLVSIAVSAAKELLRARPTVTDYVAELAIGHSLSRRSA